jgi:hypothetical protein
VPGHGQPGAVGEPVGDGGVEADEVDGVLQRAAGGVEQVAQHLRQGDQARAGVEGVPVALVPAELAADVARPLQHRHPVPERGQPRGRGQSAESRADDHHP